VEGATENAATVQALLDNLVSRGLDPTVPRLFIVDGAKALSKAIRPHLRSAAAIQRCQIHKAAQHHGTSFRKSIMRAPVGCAPGLESMTPTRLKN